MKVIVIHLERVVVWFRICFRRTCSPTRAGNLSDPGTNDRSPLLFGLREIRPRPHQARSARGGHFPFAGPLL